MATPTTTSGEVFPYPGTGDSGFIDNNTYVGYYACKDPTFKCPDSSTVPGWKVVLTTDVAIGSHGGCPNCLMTQITWKRIDIIPCPTGQWDLSFLGLGLGCQDKNLVLAGTGVVIAGFALLFKR